MQGTHCEKTSDLQEQAAACCLRLVSHDISAATDPMTHREMSIGYHLGEYARLPFANPTLLVEIVTVHHGKRVEKVAKGEFVERLVRELSLRENLLHNLIPLVDGILPQSQVGRIHDSFSQLKVTIVHILFWEIWSHHTSNRFSRIDGSQKQPDRLKLPQTITSTK